MNDFTKDELRMIAAVLLPTPEEFFIWTEAQKNLQRKVVSMIDNYCDHIWNANPYDFVISCKICGQTTSSDSQGKLINE